MKNKATKYNIFLFLLDTGGWLHIRLPIFLFYILKLLRDKRVLLLNKRVVLIGNLLVFFLLPSIINGYLNHKVNLLHGLKFYAPIILFVPTYIIIRNTRLRFNHLQNAGILFSVFIISFFLLLIIQFPVAQKLLFLIQNNPQAGFFDSEKVIYGIKMPSIYFKATLLLVPIGVSLLYQNKWRGVILIMASLFIAYSKFAILILSGAIVLKLLNKYLKVFSIPIALFFLVILSLTLASPQELILGFSTRFSHVTSIWATLRESWIDFLFGQGGGSDFYTTAIVNNQLGGWINDSEFSQFEVLRRYGLVFSIFITAIFVGFYKKCKKDKETEILSYTFLSYYLASMSNPVLLTLPAIIFYALLVKEYQLIKIRRSTNHKAS